jgi:hypothetical protein
MFVHEYKTGIAWASLYDEEQFLRAMEYSLSPLLRYGRNRITHLELKILSCVMSTSLGVYKPLFTYKKEYILK